MENVFQIAQRVIIKIQMHLHLLLFALLVYIIAKVVIITLIVMNAILLISGMKHHYLVHYHMAVIMELFIIRHLDNAQIAKMQFEIVILALIVLIVQNAMDYISQRLMEVVNAQQELTKILMNNHSQIASIVPIIVCPVTMQHIVTNALLHLLGMSLHNYAVVALLI